jgi:hypothetical protein
MTQSPDISTIIQTYENDKNLQYFAELMKNMCGIEQNINSELEKKLVINFN